MSLRGIKAKVVLFATLAALVPTLVTAVIAYANSRRALSDGTRESLQSASSQASREVNLWLSDRVRDLRVFARSHVVTENLEVVRSNEGDESASSRSRSRLASYLEAVVDQFEDYQALFVVDLHSQIVAKEGDGDARLGLPPNWLDRLGVDRVVLGDHGPDPTNGASTIAIGVPAHGADGRLIGGVAATLDLRVAGEILTMFAPGHSGLLHLATDDGTLAVSASGSGLYGGDRNLGAPLVSAIRVHKTLPIGYVDSRGTEMVGSFKRLPLLDLVIVAEVPKAEAYAPMARLRNLTIIVVGLLLLGVGYVAYRLSLLIVRPLDRLTQAAAEVAEGDLAVDLPVMGEGEVGNLTAVFNNMVGRLREGRRKLDAINEELRLKNEDLERLSITDGLTGLYNRRHLMDSLENEARRTRRSKQPFAILLLDVDHFKDVNDSYGHQVGDDVLARIGSILGTSIREVDIAGRYGGEEFMLILLGTGIDGAITAAERIRDRIEKHSFVFRTHSISITVSIGAAQLPEDGDTPERVLAAADGALYEAKHTGRNRVRAAPRAVKGASEHTG